MRSRENEKRPTLSAIQCSSSNWQSIVASEKWCIFVKTSIWRPILIGLWNLNAISVGRLGFYGLIFRSVRPTTMNATWLFILAEGNATMVHSHSGPAYTACNRLQPRNACPVETFTATCVSLTCTGATWWGYTLTGKYSSTVNSATTFFALVCSKSLLERREVCRVCYQLLLNDQSHLQWEYSEAHKVAVVSNFLLKILRLFQWK